MLRREFLASGAVGTVGLLTTRSLSAQSEVGAPLAKSAYTFAYPLVLMDLTQRTMAGGGGDGKAGLNQFLHYTQFLAANFTAIVGPMTDMLHSSAWLHVKQEPMVVTVPDLKGRYCLGSIFHAWHDVLKRFGSTVDGGKPVEFLVTAPGWKGNVPKQLTHLSSPTSLVWVPVWIDVKNAADLPAALAVQMGFKVTRLSEWRPPPPPPNPASALFARVMKAISPPPGAFPPGAFPPGAVPPMPGAVVAAPAEQVIGADGVPIGPPPKAPMPVAPVEQAVGADGVPVGPPPKAPPMPEPGREMPAPTPEPGGGATVAGSPPPGNPRMGADGVPIGPQGMPPGSPPPAAPAGYQPPGAEGDSMGMGMRGGVAGGLGGPSPNQQLFQMSDIDFYKRFCQLMVENPPLEADAPFAAKIAKMGLIPSESVDLTTQKREVQQALVSGARDAGKRIYSTKGKLKVLVSKGWETALNVEDFGVDYDRRAYSALMHFGAAGPHDLLSPRINKDDKGKSLAGPGRYTLQFAKGQLPPAEHHWTLAVYRSPDLSIVDTPAGRNYVNSRQEFAAGADGSITFYLQKDNPGVGKETNWLPIPDGPFEVVMRLFGPKSEVTSQTWKPPAVVKV